MTQQTLCLPGYSLLKTATTEVIRFLLLSIPNSIIIGMLISVSVLTEDTHTHMLAQVKMLALMQK